VAGAAESNCWLAVLISKQCPLPHADLSRSTESNSVPTIVQELRDLETEATAAAK
jgi:hypothetical protein